MISLQPLFDLDGAGLAALLDEGRAEGFRFLERLATEWSSGELRFQRPGEVLLGVYDDAQLVAVGGAAAADHYRRLVLRTDTVAAARFYEGLGYAPLPPGSAATHHRWLDVRALS